MQFKWTPDTSLNRTEVPFEFRLPRVDGIRMAYWKTKNKGQLIADSPVAIQVLARTTSS